MIIPEGLNGLVGYLICITSGLKVYRTGAQMQIYSLFYIILLERYSSTWILNDEALSSSGTHSLIVTTYTSTDS